MPDLLKEVLPLISTYLLDIINVYLLRGHVPHFFKVAVIKPLLKKPTLDTEVLANYRPISNLPFFSKILEKVGANQLCDFLHLASTVAQWLALSPHSMKALGLNPGRPGRSRSFLCGFCMFSSCLRGFTPVSPTIIKTCTAASPRFVWM